MFKKLFFPALFLLIGYVVFFNSDAKVIASGVAIFLVGMVFMEDGFKVFSGGTLEKLIEKCTSNIYKAIGTGFVTTTTVQSSSLISVVIISFLSAELITLTQAIGVIFGSNIGSTTTAWIVSSLGVKIKIATLAMPMLVFGVLMKFLKANKRHGIGNILLGLGFMFLGIGYMKEGFDTLKDAIDLSQYAMAGYLGVFTYILVGAVATVVIQSSGATMAIIITALATGQIDYVNALALAIGANVGTTVTAALGAITSNENGKRLAVAHLIFNITTGLVAVIFIYQLKDLVDVVATWVGIGETNFAMKLALFHTIFNVIGVIIVAPFRKPLVKFLLTLFVSTTPDESKPKYLDDASASFPDVAITAIRKEVMNLYEKSQFAILHGMNLHRTNLLNKESDVQRIIEEADKAIDFDIKKMYLDILKPLYGEIIRFSSISEQNMNETEITKVTNLKFVTRKLIESVKDAKRIRRNVLEFWNSDNKHVKGEYDFIRLGIAKIMNGIHLIESGDLTLKGKEKKINELVRTMDKLDFIENGRLDTLIREGKIDKKMATSLMNDSAFSYDLSNNMIEIANILWVDGKQNI